MNSRYDTERVHVVLNNALTCRPDFLMSESLPKIESRKVWSRTHSEDTGE